jgi:hypothetical protein
MGFAQGFGIDTVSLAATSIGFDVLGGDNPGLVPRRTGLLPPVSCCAARFHQDHSRRL